MTELEMKQLLREKGLCGHIDHIDGPNSDRYACILARHHDSDVHERGWQVIKCAIRPAYKRDEREPDEVVYAVKDSSKTFTTANEAHANWLASTLTRLDL